MRLYWTVWWIPVILMSAGTFGFCWLWFSAGDGLGSNEARLFGAALLLACTAAACGFVFGVLLAS